MNKILSSIAAGVFLTSALIYLVFRVIFPGLMSDNTGDLFLWSGGISLFLIVLLRSNRVPTNIRLGIIVMIGLLILFLTIFGLWGMFTSAGNREFPELAALVPFFALLAALILAVFMGILALIWRKKKR